MKDEYGHYVNDAKRQKYHLSSGEVLSNQGSQSISIATKLNPLFLSQRGDSAMPINNESSSSAMKGVLDSGGEVKNQNEQDKNKQKGDGSLEGRRATAMTRLFRGRTAISPSKHTLKRRQAEAASWKQI